MNKDHRSPRVRDEESDGARLAIDGNAILSSVIVGMASSFATSKVMGDNDG